MMSIIPPHNNGLSYRNTSIPAHFHTWIRLLRTNSHTYTLTSGSWLRPSIPLLLVALLLNGCNSPSAGLVSTQQEIQVGKQAAAQFEAQTRTSEDPAIDEIAARLVAVQPRHDLPWRYRVAETNEVNAFALPGGYIYVYRGLLNLIRQDPNMIAAVLAHETSHVVDRHAVKLMEQQAGIGSLIDLATRDKGALQQLMDIVGTAITEGYSRQEEYQADHDGVHWMARAGYNPQGMVSLLETLQRKAPNGGGGLTRYFDSHPGTPGRIQRVQDQIARGEY